MKKNLLNILIIVFICIVICGCNSNTKKEDSITYPDFITKDRYTLDEVSKFCIENGVTLVLDYVEDSLYPSGTLLTQSKEFGIEVESGDILTISIAK